MPHVRPLCASLLALCLAAACARDTGTTATGPSTDRAAAAEDLALSMPVAEARQLMTLGTRRSALVDGPARVTEGEEGTAEEDPTPYLSERGTIYDARTLTGFGPDFAYSWAEHRYQGNKGRVETTATVWSGSAAIGSQSAAREDFGLFLLDGPRVKYIAVKAEAYVADPCGLAVTGASRHLAWWEWFLGPGNAPTWGLTERPSSAPAKTQAPCAEEPTTGGGGGSSGGAGTVCWFSIDYDEDTGEIVASELLFCTGMSEQIGG